VFEIDPVLTQTRIEVAKALFAAWSSGDVDAPRAHLAPDAVLFDIIGGEPRGWPAIRAYFQHGLDRYPDLALTPTGDFWARPDGLAMLWVMTGTQGDDSLGAAARGRTWSAEGLSYLVFDGLRVVREADYHDKGSRARSLGVTP
jgi:SnoaL-like domain